MQLSDIGELPAEIDAGLAGDESDPFGLARHPGLRFRPKTSHVLLRDDDGSPVACAGLVLADVQAGDTPLAVVGIGGVIVHPARRGTGLARRVVEAALLRARTMGPPVALLFCLPDRAGLYERLGFATVGDAVTVPQPDGPTTMPLMAMWRALVPGASWPTGPVLLADLPF